MPNNFDTSIIIRCFTTEHMENLKKKDPGLQARLDIFEEQISGEVENMGSGDNTTQGQ